MINDTFIPRENKANRLVLMKQKAILPWDKEGVHEITMSSPSAPWILRPVFLSSTFRDMHAERDYLRDFIFPDLEKKLHERRHHLETIDLRWGVETVSIDQEHAKELLVLKVCLAEIERSRPFLIVLIGERYGWVPPEERMKVAAQEAGFTGEIAGKSVTALEIEFGALSSSDQLSRTWFYFRDPLPLDQMSKEEADKYREDDPDPAKRLAAAKRLTALKNRIEKEHPDRVRHYSLEWDDKKNQFKEEGTNSLKAFGQRVLEDLWENDLDGATIKYAHQPDPTWQQEERWELETFVEDRGRGFLGREETVQELIDLALSPVSQNGTVGASVTGQAGAGKSSLFAHLFRQLENEDILLLSNAAGISLRSQQVDSLLQRWIGELAEFLNIEDPSVEMTDAEELETTFASLLGRAAMQKRVVVLMDALNQFMPTVRAQRLTWWPKLWSDNARVIATAIPGSASAALEQRPGIEAVALPLLTEVETEQIVHAVCLRYHRTIHLAVVQQLLDKKSDGKLAAGIPLWLELAVEELNLLDADDFQRAEKEYTGTPEAKLHQLLLDTAKNLPATVAEIYAAMLERTEKVAGKSLARCFANFITLSRAGWRESDLEYLLPRITGEKWDGLQFAILQRSFRAHLVRRGAGGQYDFFHQQMRLAVHRRNLQDHSLVIKLHTHLANYLETLSPEEPLRQTELMFHLIGTENRLKVAQYYGDYLNEQEEAGATRALANFILEDAKTETETHLQWVLSLPELEELSGEQQHKICNRFMFPLAEALENETKLPTRMKLFRQAQTTLTRLVSQDPTNADWQHSLSVSHGGIGDVLLTQNDADGALAAYRKFKEIVEHLAAQDRTNTRLHQDLIASRQRIGNVLLKQGDTGGALAAYRECQEIAEHLLTQVPKNTGLNLGLLAGYIGVGDVLLARGDAVGALDAYREALDGAQRLASQEPTNVIWHHNLSVSHSKIADVLLKQRDTSGALLAYWECQKIAERLSSHDPTNAGWQKLLSASHNRIGEVLLAQGSADGALAAYRKSLAISERLASQDPTNATWQHDLSSCYDGVGEALLKKGDATGALAAYREFQKIVERLSSQDPTNTDWLRDLSVSHNRIGDVLKEQVNAGEALAVYRKSLAIDERLVFQDPTNAEWHWRLAVSYFQLGGICHVKGDTTDGNAWFGKCYQTLIRMQKLGMQLDSQATQLLAQLEQAFGEF